MCHCTLTLCREKEGEEMESFILALSVVVPLVVYMASGGLVRKLGIMKEAHFKAVNDMVFRLFIPLTLFFNIYRVDLKTAIQPKVAGYCLAGTVLVFALVWLVTDRFVEDLPTGSSIIQGSYRSNFVLFGNMIALTLCDARGVALVSALSAIVVPVFNILAVILFEVRRGNAPGLSGILLSICRNPLVDAGVLGCVFNLLHLRLPVLLEEPLSVMADMATPLALVTLGGLLSFGSMVSHRKYLAAVTAVRLVFVPAVMLGAAVLLGFRENVLVAVLAVFASPTAVASAPMAQAMGGNGALAAEIVAVTSVCCILTIFLFVFGLSWAGMF